ncbi:unnamed protein product, partial [Didymodactylos carnosus]
NAYNGRQHFVKELMSHIRIDSYGTCLNSLYSPEAAQSQRQQPGGNQQLYSKYKFVLSIENSNCEDYVTEKLIDAISSTSVPIVASREKIPDYDRFAPKHSYINIYDYESPADLAHYLNYLIQNKTAYNEYLWFRKSEISSSIKTLKENILFAENILGKNSTMRRWLIAKERSINKYCKLVEYIHTTYWNLIYKRKKFNRPLSSQICLPQNDLQSYFSKSKNS